jgi:hypothetical protein
VACQPRDLVRLLEDPVWWFARFGSEVGFLSQLAFSSITKAGLLVACIETRYTKVFQGAGEQERSQ